MKWAGPTTSGLRGWILVAFLMELVGLMLHLLAGGLVPDVLWLALTVTAAIVVLVGYYRHPPQR